jgi:hypothetical protein
MHEAGPHREERTGNIVAIDKIVRGDHWRGFLMVHVRVRVFLFDLVQGLYAPVAENKFGCSGRPSPTVSHDINDFFCLILPSSSGGFQPGGFGALTCGIRGAAQLLVFVRQEGMRLAGVRLYRCGLFQVGQGLGESAVQKQHAPQK